MKKLAVTSIVLSAGLVITLLLSTTSDWIAPVLVTLLTLLWLTGLNLGWGWSYDTGFLTLIVAAAWGLRWDTSPLWMSVVVVLALIGWDLSRFLARLDATTPEERLQFLQNEHIRHLIPVLLVILVVTVAGLTVQIRLSLGLTILIGFVLVLSLGWLLREVGREEPG